ncbi:hypothetical protein Prudu_012988 [Prunus dulcis]|uniref:Aminotransferase-like plant mobile domain-containing protein n=1 Tax=Prunus dulcis TaxID=3755 RepID=A0A4Y1REX0_PRUDU|nr:hypothetical protein Prudu_012988 [Prunus dulcis]
MQLYREDKDHQHILFLLYWLNGFIFPNRSSAVLLECRHLDEALHNHTGVGLGPTALAHLFKNLHTATLENPLNLSAPDIVLPKDQVLALPLMSAEVPKRSIEEYLMFFRHCTKRSATQRQVVIRRTYPWSQPRYRLFENEPEEETARTNFRKKFLSVTRPRDLPRGGGKPPNYHLGAEVHHPNFCARQIEVHKDSRCAVNKISNSADALYPSWVRNSCSSAKFDAWWKARFQGLPASSTALKVLFDGWDSWMVYAGVEAKQFMMQMIKDINAQILPLQRILEVSLSSYFCHSCWRLEAPFVDEEDQRETLAEQPTVEATPSARRNKRKKAALARTVLSSLKLQLKVLLLLILSQKGLGRERWQNK